MSWLILSSSVAASVAAEDKCLCGPHDVSLPSSSYVALESATDQRRRLLVGLLYHAVPWQGMCLQLKAVPSLWIQLVRE